MYLYDLPSQKKNVPELIKDPVALIKDVRNLVERHCKDSPELAITGRAVLHPDLNKSFLPLYDDNGENGDNGFGVESSSDQSGSGQFVTPHQLPNKAGARGPYKKHQVSSTSPTGHSLDRSNSNLSNAPRRRRTRCKICEACQRSDCGECSFCLDMVKFGGKFPFAFYSHGLEIDFLCNLRPGTCKANLYDATMSAAYAACNCAVRFL